LFLASENLPIEAAIESQDACLNFIIERLRNVLLDEGYRYDVVDAVVAEQGHNPAKAAQAVRELMGWVDRDDWDTILPAYSRCVRIIRSLDQQFVVEPARFVEPATNALFSALELAKSVDHIPGSVDNFLNAFLPMIPAIDQFFDDVLVMDEDQQIRENRLALLQQIAALASGVADMSKLEGF
jgi:glycyl-tRNA synthetase